MLNELGEKLEELKNKVAYFVSKRSPEAELDYLNRRYSFLMQRLDLSRVCVKEAENGIKKKTKNIKKFKTQAKKFSTRAAKAKNQSDKDRYQELLDKKEKDIKANELEIEALTKWRQEMEDKVEFILLEIDKVQLGRIPLLKERSINNAEAAFDMVAKMEKALGEADEKSKKETSKALNARYKSPKKTRLDAAHDVMSRMEKNVEKKEKEATEIKAGRTPDAMKEYAKYVEDKEYSAEELERISGLWRHQKKNQDIEFKKFAGELAGELTNQLKQVNEVLLSFKGQKLELSEQLETTETKIKEWQERVEMAKKQDKPEIEELCLSWVKANEKDKEELEEVIAGVRAGMKEVEAVKFQIENYLLIAKDQELKSNAEKKS